MSKFKIRKLGVKKIARNVKNLAEEMAEDIAKTVRKVKVLKNKDYKKVPDKLSRRHENMLFLRRLLKNPKTLGAIVPSSRKLGQFICRHVVCNPGEYVLEVGAGTGSFTQALLESGVSPDQLIVVELDGELANFLCKRFPKIIVLHGSAADLENLLPAEVMGQVRTIVSGIPLVNLSRQVQQDLIQSFFSVTLPDARVLQFTYRPIAPIPAKEFNLKSRRLGVVYMNFPPATVWSFVKACS